MKGLLPLLFCIEIILVQLYGAQPSDTSGEGGENSLFVSESDPPRVDSTTSEASIVMSSPLSSTVSQVSSSHYISSLPHPLSTTAKPTTTKSPTTTTITTTTSTIAAKSIFSKKECISSLLVAGGLMILCVILLVSSLLLTWKVCHLNRRLKMLSSNSDLVSNTEYWMGNAKKNKSNSKEEAKESSLLMADFNNTQENAGSDATKEEGGKVNMDGQMGDENEEEKGDTGKSDEASAAGNIEEMPVTDAENASSSRPPEGTTDSQVTKDGAASSSEGREEPQDVV